MRTSSRITHALLLAKQRQLQQTEVKRDRLLQEVLALRSQCAEQSRYIWIGIARSFGKRKIQTELVRIQKMHEAVTVPHIRHRRRPLTVVRGDGRNVQLFFVKEHKHLIMINVDRLDTIHHPMSDLNLCVGAFTRQRDARDWLKKIETALRRS